MDTTRLVSEEWGYAVSLMPGDLEESCRHKLALTRRRQVLTASDLLRLCFAYGLCDMSLRQVAAWAATIGLAQLSDVAVLKRLRSAADWLGHLVAQWLVERGLTTAVPRGAMRIVDATSVSVPGSRGTDWRLHVGFDLGAERITSVELTGPGGGETLRRHRFSAGEIVLADRGYATRLGLASVLGRRAHLVVRGHLSALPLRTRAGRRLDLAALLATLGPNEIGDWPVELDEGGRLYSLRLVAIKKTAAAADKERKRIRTKARRNGRRVAPSTVAAAAYTFVLTDLAPERASALEVLELYRLRWQIELVFKRLKSVLTLDALRAKDPRLARSYLMAKILGALVVEEMSGAALAFFPWGFRLPRAAAEPLAPAGAVG
jgi:hypothetical protein